MEGTKGGTPCHYTQDCPTKYHIIYAKAVITLTYELPSELGTSIFIWNGPVKQYGYEKHVKRWGPHRECCPRNHARVRQPPAWPQWPERLWSRLPCYKRDRKTEACDDELMAWTPCATTCWDFARLYGSGWRICRAGCEFERDCVVKALCVPNTQKRWGSCTQQREQDILNGISVIKFSFHGFFSHPKTRQETCQPPRPWWRWAVVWCLDGIRGFCLSRWEDVGQSWKTMENP